MTTRADVVVVGAGIVGLATARALLLRHPGMRVVVLDRADRVAAHQSGHNSGVVHAGVYYPAGSAKARLCRAGRAELLRYCAECNLPVATGGKVVVATAADEVPRLDALAARAAANGVVVRPLDRRALAELEPHVNGVAAFHVPGTAVVDFGAVAASFAADVRDLGGEVVVGTAVQRVVDPPAGPVRVETDAGAWACRGAIVCAGLHADRLAAGAGAVADDGGPLPRIVPFRGEYRALRPERAHLVRSLVYPVPDPRLPFLGVHLTRGIDGEVHAGPNAVPAFAREGYRWRTVSPRDVAALVGDRATWRLARRFWRTEAEEVVRSLSARTFARAVQRLVPEVTAADLVPAGAGVRAQAVTAEGTLLDDFAFAATARTVHVLNAPSPAATASMAIAGHIVDRLVTLGAVIGNGS